MKESLTYTCTSVGRPAPGGVSATSMTHTGYRATRPIATGYQVPGEVSATSMTPNWRLAPSESRMFETLSADRRPAGSPPLA